MGILDPEAAIVARLQARIDEGTWTTSKKPRVLAAADLANMEERSQIVPALYVIFDGYEPTQQVGDGRVQEISQDWTIAVAVRNAYSHQNAQGVRDEANPLIDLVLGAMLGWSPGTGFRTFKMQPGVGPVFSDAGFGYFPLQFQTRVAVRGV